MCNLWCPNANSQKLSYGSTSSMNRSANLKSKKYMNCKSCNKPLSESQYKNQKSLKSCPLCSVNNGDYHVYYRYPEAFGTTSKRATQNSPEGAQSYCTSCRGNQGPTLSAILCSDL